MPGPARAVPAIIAPLRRKLRRLSRCFGSVAMLPLLAMRRKGGVPSALPHTGPRRTALEETQCLARDEADDDQPDHDRPRLLVGAHPRRRLTRGLRTHQ